MAVIDKQVTEATSHSAWVMVTVIIIAFAFSIIVGFFITRSITGPIRQAVEAAERVAEGDVRVSIVSESRDEAGQLLSAMGKMVHALDEMSTAATSIAAGDLKVK